MRTIEPLVRALRTFDATGGPAIALLQHLTLSLNLGRPKSREPERCGDPGAGPTAFPLQETRHGGRPHRL